MATVTYMFSTSGQFPLVRFASTISNPGVYPVTGAAVTWTAYNSANAIVGSHVHDSYAIPALSSITYVGGAGSVNLSGAPARVAVAVTNPGHYMKTVPATLPVTTVALANSTTGGSPFYADATSYTVTGNVTVEGPKPVASADLDISITLLNSAGAVVGADFWDTTTQLPSTLNPGTKIGDV